MKLPKKIFVKIDEFGLIAGQSVTEFENEDTVGVYELKEVKKVLVTKELVNG